MAIKLPDAHGPGIDQDLLLTSSADRPLLRRLLFPASSFVRGAFSSALPELRAAAADGLGFELRAAGSFGRSQPLATVTVGRPLPENHARARLGCPSSRFGRVEPRRRAKGFVLGRLADHHVRAAGRSPSTPGTPTLMGCSTCWVGRSGHP